MAYQTDEFTHLFLSLPIFLFSIHLALENERSKLDPLPEEKMATTTPASTTPQTNEPYKRVYGDWRATTTTTTPTAISTMERSDSESTYQDSTAKDKDDLSSMKSDKLRTSPSSTSISSNPATPLQSIIEEDRRPSQDVPLSKSAMRRGSDAINEYEPVYQKHNTLSPVAITSDSHSIYIRPLVTSTAAAAATSPSNLNSATGSIVPSRKSASSSPERRDSSNKIEIDSDNIETPPVVRKNLLNSDDKSMGSAKKLQAPRPLHQRTIDESLANDAVADTKANNEVESLGDGHFDRHSSARRTRRYRRPTDHSSGNEMDRNDSSPETVPSNPIFPNLYTNLDHDINKDTSPDRGDDETLSKSKSMDILSRIGRQGRNMSSINQEAVREAIRKLKSPTETPERIWSPPREIVVTPKDRCMASKALNHAELNDEGFEETQSCQSLVSDGKDSTSSCNDAADQTQSHPSAISPTQQSKSKSAVKSLMERNRQSLERSRSLRTSSTTSSSMANSMPHSRSTIIPKRTNSLRRTIDTGTMSSNKQDVERSGSRTSLRSSRSSLNSSASINTVRNMSGLKSSGIVAQPTATNVRQLSADKASMRKKLVQQQSTPSSAATQPHQSNRGTLKGSNSLNSYLRARTPASRSSSSGSSIGGPSRQSYTKNSTSSNSITPPSISSPQRPAFRNTVSISNNIRSTSGGSGGGSGGGGVSSSGRLTNLKGIASKTSNRVSSFMRPTTSSATKVHSSSNRSK